jgi:hypothetical protein
MKNPEDFWKEYDATLAQVRADRIVTERVTPLRHDMTAKARADIAIRSIMSGVETLEALSQDASEEISRDAHQQLDEADTRISLLRMRLRMRRATIHLCSQFGKAP